MPAAGKISPSPLRGVGLSTALVSTRSNSACRIRRTFYPTVSFASAAIVLVVLDQMSSTWHPPVGQARVPRPKVGSAVSAKSKLDVVVPPPLNSTKPIAPSGKGLAQSCVACGRCASTCARHDEVTHHVPMLRVEFLVDRDCVLVFHYL